MRRPLDVLSAVVLVMATSGAWHQAEAQSELAGGWIVTSWTTSDGDMNSEPQRGLFVFAATGQYSMMYVPGDDPRPRYSGDTQTEAETLSAYESFVANSGRYRVEGNRLVYEAYVAKDPNYMADWNADDPGNPVTVEFSITDDILTLKWVDGFNAGQTAMLRRPGQG